MILSCIKTGRWWRVISHAEAAKTRWDNGLVDYLIEDEKCTPTN